MRVNQNTAQLQNNVSYALFYVLNNSIAVHWPNPNSSTEQNTHIKRDIIVCPLPKHKGYYRLAFPIHATAQHTILGEEKYFSPVCEFLVKETIQTHLQETNYY